mgnify:FL=1
MLYKDGNVAIISEWMILPSLGLIAQWRVWISMIPLCSPQCTVAGDALKNILMLFHVLMCAGNDG